MTKVERLKREAKDGARWRGHTMNRFIAYVTGDGRVYVSTCKRCMRSVSVNPAPPPNGIDVGGEAVALNCD
jgi:hypothetical protein